MGSFGAARTFYGKDSDKRLLGVCKATNRDLTLLTHDCGIVSLHSQSAKLIQCWNCSTSRGSKITGAAVILEGDDEVVIVQDRNTLRVMKLSNFSDAETYTVKHSIHSLLPVLGHEPLVVFSNGSICCLNKVLEDPSDIEFYCTMPYHVQEIVHIDASPKSDGSVVIFGIFQVEQCYFVMTVLMNSEEENTQYVIEYLEFEQSNILSVCTLYSDAIPVSAAVLWNDSLTHLQMFPCGPYLDYEIRNLVALESGSRMSLMVALSEDQIVLLSADGKATHFDLKFGSIIQRVDLVADLVKVFFCDNALFLDTPTSVLKIPVSAPSVLLSKALLKSCSYENMNVVYDANWNLKSDQIPLFSNDEKKQIHTLIHTRQEVNFNRTVMDLMKNRSEEFKRALCSSVSMNAILSRFGYNDDDGSFWPESSLRLLICSGYICGKWCSGLLSKVICRENWSLASDCFKYLTDIPEPIITRCISSIVLRFTSCTDVADSVECGHCDFDFPEELSMCLNKILKLPFTEGLLREEIAIMPYQAVHNLIIYLTKLLGKPCLCELDPSLDQIICWLCLLLDAHISEMVLLKESWPAIEKLQEVVEAQGTIFKEVLALDRLMAKLNSKPKNFHGKNPFYSVEIMHF